MTIIEVMVAIAIVVVVASGATYGFGLITRTNLRSACMKIIAASHYAFDHAVASGMSVRIVLDAEKGTMALEQAHGRVTLVRADDSRRREIEDANANDTDPKHAKASLAAVDPWAAAKAGLQKTLKPSFGASPFSAITNEDGSAVKRFQATPLGNGVRIVKMFLPHDPHPVEHGRGEIYFFPTGRTENVVIQLTDTREEIFSVELHELTGRGNVYNRAYEPKLIPNDASEEQRSEIGDTSL